MGEPEGARAERVKAGATISTPEEIAAWLAGGSTDWFADLSKYSPRAREVALLSRRMIVRLCPEADDYQALCRRLYRLPGYPVPENWHDEASDADVIAHLEKYIALLWAPALSAARAFTESDEVPS